MRYAWFGFVGIMVIGFVAVLGFVVNPICQGARIVNKTIDADNVIYNYEWFRQRWQDTLALDAKIVGADAEVHSFAVDAGPRSGWKRGDREEHFRLRSIRLGLKQQRNDLAAEYNARAAMANRSIFMGSDVPDSIAIEPWSHNAGTPKGESP